MVVVDSRFNEKIGIKRIRERAANAALFLKVLRTIPVHGMRLFLRN